jgi:hypothetical protein
MEGKGRTVRPQQCFYVRFAIDPMSKNPRESVKSVSSVVYELGKNPAS